MKQLCRAQTILYAMILAAALVLTLFGGRLFGVLTQRRTASNDRRSTLSYVQSKLQAADAAGGVSIEAGPEGDLLVLPEGETGYETRIYLSSGFLREEYVRTGSPLSPDTAQVICEADSFSVTMRDPEMLSVSADGASALIHLHSEGGVLS